jgi:GT2 family glycosyltransferase
LQLSVVILNYNVSYFLQLCLSSVLEATKNINAEIIVVDNNSTDDSCEKVKQLFPKVKLIENKTNFGFSKGNNIGVEHATGDYLCILNPDTVVAEDTFSKLIEFANQTKNLGIIGCQLIDGAGSFLPESKRYVPTPKVALQKIFGYTKNYYNTNLKPDEIGKTDVLVGAFMFLKQSVYHEVAGFDEDYFMYGEDIDLSYKILKAGYTNYYFGETLVVHFKGESTLKDKLYADRFYGAMHIFYQKHFKRNVILSALVKAGISLASKWPNTTSKASVDTTKSIIISDRKWESLEDKTTPPLAYSTLPEQDFKNTLVVLDANYLGYKAIIEYMSCDNTSSENTYRILPKNSTFILGSDSALQRGEVVDF